uniref:Globin family profile domain-containing protein n=1 Tax=Setaria digitata TaxID=48799 RepID=A0A915Q4R4_9BILA
MVGRSKKRINKFAQISIQKHCGYQSDKQESSTDYFNGSTVKGLKERRQGNLETLPIEKAQNSKTPMYKRLNLTHPKSTILNRNMQADVSDCWRAIKIFKVCPELRNVFRIPSETVDLNDHVPFHRSSKLFASMIDLCIRNIHALEAEMDTVLIIYGRRHYRRRKQGFRVSYFAVFEKCVLDFVSDNISDDQKKSKLLEGWYLIISYIRNKMTCGVELEKQKEWETAKVKASSLKFEIN